jgi:hypothetical protein
MNFGEWAKQQEDAGLAEVHELTQLQYAEAGDGPFALYIYGRDGMHSGKKWFRKGKMKYPDEEITVEDAKKRVKEAIAHKKEVRICDGGDMLVFHAAHGKVIYPNSAEEFWGKI